MLLLAEWEDQNLPILSSHSLLRPLSFEFSLKGSTEFKPLDQVSLDQACRRRLTSIRKWIRSLWSAGKSKRRPSYSSLLFLLQSHGTVCSKVLCSCIQNWANRGGIKKTKTQACQSLDLREYLVHSKSLQRCEEVALHRGWYRKDWEKSLWASSKVAGQVPRIRDEEDDRKL